MKGKYRKYDVLRELISLSRWFEEQDTKVYKVNTKKFNHIEINDLRCILIKKHYLIKVLDNEIEVVS